MVRLVSMAALLVLALPAGAERKVYDAESLKQRMESSAEQDQRASERIKASRGDVQSLNVLDEDDLSYELPDGRYVPGVMLPNGKAAPAMPGKEGKRPACVTRDMQLVPGRYNAEQEAIECEVPREELAVLDEESAAQMVTAGKSDDEPEEDESLAKADKYGAGESEDAQDAESEPDRPAPEPEPSRSAPSARPENPNIYVPPGRNTSSEQGVGVVMKRDKNHFGIPIGTWAEGELLRRVSSAESGFIEFRITESIEGSHQVLPAGTMLFARKSINESRRRLESVTVRARLPNGREVPGVKFRVYSTDKTAGLNGELIRDRQGELVTAGKNAVLDAAGDVAVQASDNLAAGMASEVKDEMVDQEQEHIRRAPRPVIEVTPREVLLQVVEGF